MVNKVTIGSEVWSDGPTDEGAGVRHLANRGWRRHLVPLFAAAIEWLDAMIATVQGYRDAAVAARDQAAAWAETPAGIDVPGAAAGSRSALHYATAAGESASAADASADAAADFAAGASSSAAAAAATVAAATAAIITEASGYADAAAGSAAAAAASAASVDAAAIAAAIAGKADATLANVSANDFRTAATAAGLAGGGGDTVLQSYMYV